MFLRWVGVSLLASLSVAFPPILLKLRGSWISTTYFHSSSTADDGLAIFELFGLTAAAALLANLAWQLSRGGWKVTATRWFAICSALVAFNYLYLFSEYSSPSDDYRVYERGLQASLDGQDPYEVGFLYPPLTLDGFMVAYKLVYRIHSAIIGPPALDTVLQAVFYLYQSSQFGLLLLCFNLSFRFARAVRLPWRMALLLTTGLFLVNNPLYETIRWNQANLLVLSCILVSLLIADSHPVLAGAALAFGIHIKLYPAALIFAFALSKRWTVLLSTFAWTIFFFLVSLLLGTSLTVWSVFADFLRNSFIDLEGAARSYDLRVNNLGGLVHNLLSIFLDPGLPSSRPWFKLLGLISLAFTGTWFARRLWIRQRGYASVGRHQGLEKFHANAMDLLGASLVMSPLVWEHHYVFAVPIAIWATVCLRRRAPLPLAIGILLMLVVPTNEVFPLSYHRLAGLIVLMIGTRPSRAITPQPPSVIG